MPARAASSRNASCRRSRAIALFLFAVRAELAEIGPQIAGFLFILDAGENHFGAGNLRAWVLDVILERRFVPGDAGTLVGVGIVVIRRGAGMAAIDAVEFRTDFVLRILADGMAGK